MVQRDNGGLAARILSVDPAPCEEEEAASFGSAQTSLVLADRHFGSFGYVRRPNFTPSFTTSFFRFQEQVRESKASPLSPDDAEELESPTPSQIQSTGARRGAVSSEVFTEEDAASYVKKVTLVTRNYDMKETQTRPDQTELRARCYYNVTDIVSGRAERLSHNGLSGQGGREERAFLASRRE